MFIGLGSQDDEQYLSYLYNSTAIEHANFTYILELNIC